MTCRLFIDEVGNDDSSSTSERYLSLTGIITKRRSHARIITPAIEGLKTELFNHHPVDNKVILHRREIIRREPPFDRLHYPLINARWESGVLDLVERLPYIALTVLIDKHEHQERYRVWRYNPYHYCMQALVERFVLWLYRHGETGDVVVEPRFKQQDKALKKAFRYTWNNGTDKIDAQRVQLCLTSRELKFEAKQSNVCGLQLVDLLANPSHQHLKAKLTGASMEAAFGGRIVEALLRSRYARNPKDGKIDGWGLKVLP